ncbi:MAG TPA: type 4a pilus biogenesis protein PilO [Terriglobales bacterium]|nr:type 4a pilus biogenesis protein PilO [Terriglobales bacterium]
MLKLNELPPKMQAVAALAVVLGLSIAGYFLYYKSLDDANKTAQQQLSAKLAENQNLRQYEPKLQEMNRQIAMLQEQLEIQKRIVPDEKEADQFVRLVQDTAAQAGIEIRRYTARPVSTKEFFTEAPFEVELDGSYYSMLTFFEHVARLERIINVGALKVATVKKAQDAGAKKKYQYGPGETVVATCVATTFFSHDAAPTSTTAPGQKPGAPATATTAQVRR